MALAAGVDLPLPAVREQVAGAIDVVVHVERGRGGRRRVAAVAEVVDDPTARSRTRLLADARHVLAEPHRPPRRPGGDLAAGADSLGAARAPGTRRRAGGCDAPDPATRDGTAVHEPPGLRARAGRTCPVPPHRSTDRRGGIVSGLDDLIAVVTAVAAVLAGRTAYVGHRARRRLAAAVAGRTNGHASGRIPGTNPDVGGRDDSEGRGNGSSPGRLGERSNARAGHDPSRLGGTAPDERDPDRYRVGHVDDTSEAHRPRPDGDAGGHERAERRNGRRHDGWSAASWVDAATAGGGRGAAASDDDHPMDGASSGGPSHRKNGSTSDGRRMDGPPLGGSPTGGFLTGDVAAGWRSPAGVAGIVLGACAVALVAGVGVVLAGLVVAAVGAVGRAGAGPGGRAQPAAGAAAPGSRPAGQRVARRCLGAGRARRRR